MLYLKCDNKIIIKNQKCTSVTRRVVEMASHMKTFLKLFSTNFPALLDLSMSFVDVVTADVVEVVVIVVTEEMPVVMVVVVVVVVIVVRIVVVVVVTVIKLNYFNI